MDPNALASSQETKFQKTQDYIDEMRDKIIHEDKKTVDNLVDDLRYVFLANERGQPPNTGINYVEDRMDEVTTLIRRHTEVTGAETGGEESL